MPLLNDYNSKRIDAEQAGRPVWNAESEGAKLFDGVTEPCHAVVTQTPGTYACYLAGSPTVRRLLLLTETPQDFMLVKVCGWDGALESILADGEVTFLYKF